MRTPLKVGTIIQLNEIGTKKFYDFKITEIIGMGGSCIVYTAVYTDAEDNKFMMRLKEFYPEWLEIIREQNALIIENTNEFHDALRQFTEGYHKQMQFRMMPESMNSIANIQGIYEENNTRYIAMSCQNAIPIEDANLTLYDIFRVIRSVALQIANFHDNGYLYLDLKPQNVMLYPETPEMVMLFDFDSAVRMDNIQPQNLSCTDSWGAPELLQRKLRDISQKTDIYGIGALFMYLLFHRPPSLFDRRNRSGWEEEFDNSLLRSEKPEVRRMVTEIFRKTLTSNSEKRFQNCDDLLDLIEPYIEENQSPKPFLKTFLPLGNNYFCGRDREISEIHAALSENNFLILHGIGGIGKSELAKHYALTYAKEYDAAVFVRFQKNIMETVVPDSNFPVMNCSHSEDEDDSAYFKRKIEVLQSICTPRHFIILDNFDTENCDNLDALTSLPCKLLITSRVDYSDTFPQYEIDAMDDFDDLYSIMTYYYKSEVTAEDEIALEDIISAVLGHTMALELIAKHMQTMGVTPAKMYELLEENGITAGNKGKVRGFKDGNLKSKTAYEHIAMLFNIFGLSEEMKQILRYSALIGSNPIDTEDFLEYCELTDEQVSLLNSLINCGWIQYRKLEESDILLLHPLISEVLCNELKPDIAHCENFIEIAAGIAEDINIFDYEQRKQYIPWLHHTAHHIHGNAISIVILLDNLNFHIYMAEHDYENALWVHLHIVDMIHALDGQYTKELLNSYLYLRKIYSLLGNQEKKQFYEEKIKELGTSASFALLLEELCNDFIENKDYDSAVAISQQRLDSALETKDPEHIARAYAQLGNMEGEFDHFEESSQYYTQAADYMIQHIKIAESRNWSLKEMAELYSEAGDMYYEAKNFPSALECYNRSIELFDSEYGENNSYSGDIYSSIYVVYLRLNDTSKQLEYLQKVINIYERTRGLEHTDTLYWYKRLYEIYMDQWYQDENKCALEKAAETADFLSDLFIKMEIDNGIRSAQNNMDYSVTYRFLDNKSRCYEYMNKSLEQYREALDENDSVWSYVLDIAARNLAYFNDTEKAEAMLKKAVHICEINGDMGELEEIHKSLAELYVK